MFTEYCAISIWNNMYSHLSRKENDMIKICPKPIACILVTILTLFLFFSDSINIYAAEAGDSSIPPNDFGAPVSVTTYIDTDGSTVTEKVYVILDEKISRDKSGSGWYRNEKTKKWSGGSVSTYYAQGYFSWSDGNVTVTHPSGGISPVSGIDISNKSTESGTGQYGYVFNKFAYVKFSCTATSIGGFTHDLSVTIRVSESGNTI